MVDGLPTSQGPTVSGSCHRIPTSVEATITLRCCPRCQRRNAPGLGGVGDLGVRRRAGTRWWSVGSRASLVERRWRDRRGANEIRRPRDALRWTDARSAHDVGRGRRDRLPAGRSRRLPARPSACGAISRSGTPRSPRCPVAGRSTCRTAARGIRPLTASSTSSTSTARSASIPATRWSCRVRSATTRGCRCPATRRPPGWTGSRCWAIALKRPSTTPRSAGWTSRCGRRRVPTATSRCPC